MCRHVDIRMFENFLCGSHCSNGFVYTTPFKIKNSSTKCILVLSTLRMREPWPRGSVTYLRVTVSAYENT